MILVIASAPVLFFLGSVLMLVLFPDEGFGRASSIRDVPNIGEKLQSLTDEEVDFAYHRNNRISVHILSGRTKRELVEDFCQKNRLILQNNFPNDYSTNVNYMVKRFGLKLKPDNFNTKFSDRSLFANGESKILGYVTMSYCNEDNRFFIYVMNAYD